PALLLGAGHLSLGRLLAAVCDAANRTGQSWLVRQLQEQIIRKFRSPGRLHDVGYEIMAPGHAGDGCYRADSLEVAFDATTDKHLAFMREDLFATLARLAATGTTVGGCVSLRFTKRSQALLAMQRWDTTCSIEIALLKGIHRNEQVLEMLQAAAIRRGGTVHWGQHNTLGRADVARAYPGL